MIDHLIAQFHKLTRQIEIAVENDNSEKVYSLDEQLKNCWETIVSYKPETPKEATTLVEFMLDTLLSGSDQRQSDEDARRKILCLFAKMARYH